MTKSANKSSKATDQTSTAKSETKRKAISSTEPKSRRYPARVCQAFYHLEDKETQFEIEFCSISGRTKKKVVKLVDIEDKTSFHKTLIEANVSLAYTNVSAETLHREVINQARERATNRRHEVLLTGEVGWHGNRFVLPGRTIPNKANLEFLAKPKRLYAQAQVSGTFEGWLQEVAKPAACSSRLIVMTGASLVPPLLEIIGKTSGGIGLDLCGPERCGKTTGLKVAMSLLDEPTPLTWAMTRAGASALLHGHTDLPIFLDESAADRGDASIISQMTDILSGGRPDTLDPAWLADREPVRSKGKFRSVLVSTTEGQLPARRRGQRARIIGLPANRPGSFGIIDYPNRLSPPITSADEAGRAMNRLEKVCRQHYGHAFPLFIHYLVKERQELPGRISRRIAEFDKKIDQVPKDGWTHSVQSFFAFVYASLSLARRYKIIPWSDIMIQDAVVRCFEDALRYEASSATATDDTVGLIRSWISGAEKKAKVGADFDADKVESYDVIYSDDRGEAVALVQRDRLVSLVGSEAGLDRALSKIRDQRMIISTKKPQQMSRQKRLPGVSKRTRFIFFRSSFADGRNNDKVDGPD